MTQPLNRLAIRGLDKTFGQTKVLHDVEFAVAAGEVHGLAGQNGSGKSTLVKILTGVYAPDAGAALEVDGTPIHLPVRWPEVHAAGISVVHQDLGLLDELSVADNVCVGGFPTQPITRRIDRARQRELAARALQRIGADIDPGRRVSHLSAPERAEVAIARALRDHQPGEGLVIMDESTRSLAGIELERVHRILRGLAAEGTAVLLISHSLPELLAVTDRVTVLRDGCVSGAGMVTSHLTEAEIARRMLGSGALDADLELHDEADAAAEREREETALTVTGLTGQRVSGISFSVGAGEIVGITGLPGGGYEDIPALMTGAVAARSGQLATAQGHLDLTRATVAQCLRAGVAHIPEDRGRHGLALEMTVRDNIALPLLGRHAHPWFLGRAWQDTAADLAVETFDIRPKAVGRLVKTLSGGNQQKVLLAKWLGAAPTALVVHEPTQAVDVGARRDILLALRRAADQGVAIVIVSGEAADLCAVCDRIYLADSAGGLREMSTRDPDQLLELVYQSESAAEWLDTKEKDPTHA